MAGFPRPRPSLLLLGKIARDTRVMSKPKELHRDPKLFDRWWNDNVFNLQPWRKFYQDLWRVGGNLDFIHYVSGLYRFGQTSQLRVARIKELPEIRSQRRKTKRLVQEFKQRSSAMRLQEALTWERELSDMNAYLDGEQKKLEEDERLLAAAMPAYPILEKYHMQQSRQKGPGNKMDKWGSFFLLVLTEHMKECTGGKPFHRPVHRLLQIFQGKPKVDNPGVSAAVRISKLKQLHPDWKDDFKLLLRLSKSPKR